MKDLKLRTSKEEIEEFKRSPLWADMKDELEFWRDSFSQEQDSIVDNAAESNPSTASVLMHLGDINGRKKAVDYTLTMLDVFLSTLETDKEVKENDIRRDQTD